MDFLTKWIFFAIMIRVFYYLIIFTISFFLSLSVLRFQRFNYFQYFKWNIHISRDYIIIYIRMKKDRSPKAEKNFR